MSTEDTHEHETGHAGESPLELTPRELALAAGEDPDAVETEAAAPEEVESAAEVDTVSNESGEAAEPEQTAHDEAMIARATAAGLSADDAKEFGSPLALRLHVELLERINGLGKETPAADSADESPASDDATDDLLDLAEFAGTEDEPGYGELEMKLVKAVRKLQEERQELARFVQERRQQDIVSQFDNAVDRLDDERLGSTRDERGRIAEITPDQRALREKVYAEVDRLYGEELAQAQRAGGDAPPVRWSELVAKAKAAVLPEKKAAKAQALKEQSSRRRPVSTGAGSAARAGTVNEDDPVAIANSPEVKKLWSRFQAENGV